MDLRQSGYKTAIEESYKAEKHRPTKEDKWKYVESMALYIPIAPKSSQ